MLKFTPCRTLLVFFHNIVGNQKDVFSRFSNRSQLTTYVADYSYKSTKLFCENPLIYGRDLNHYFSQNPIPLITQGAFCSEPSLLLLFYQNNTDNHDQPFWNRRQLPKHDYYQLSIAKPPLGECLGKLKKEKEGHFALGAIPLRWKDTFQRVNFVLAVLLGSSKFQETEVDFEILDQRCRHLYSHG